MTETTVAPVLTLDGPGGAGKGTLSLALARHLGWQILDSGALYRAMGLIASRTGWSADSESDRAEAAARAAGLELSFPASADGLQVWLGDEEVTAEIRRSDVAENASKWAAIPEIREALLTRQRTFAAAPGLIADGRDMGTVVFPDAACKFFVTATVDARAKRRLAQLSMPQTVDNIEELYNEIDARDARDRERQASPMMPASDAIVVDTTDENPTTSLRRLVAEVERNRLI